MKTLRILLLALLLLSLTACGQAQELPASQETTQSEPQTPAEGGGTQGIQGPAEDDPSLTKLREEINTTGSLMGVAYLGVLSEGGQEAYDALVMNYLDTWPFLASLDWEDAAVVDGMEVYCVVPRDVGSQVVVTEWVIDETNGYQGEAGKILYESQSGDPVILMGNVSDILPNLRVTVSTPDGQSLSYSPCLSLRDGTLDRAAEEGIFDFSLSYDLSPSGIPDYPGDWTAFQVADGTGQRYTCCLSLQRDGTVDYFYYQEPGVILIRYTGIARNNLDENTVTLDLSATEGAYLSRGEGEHSVIGTYQMDMPDEDSLRITNLSGDPLLPGLEGQTIPFGRSMG